MNINKDELDRYITKPDDESIEPEWIDWECPLCEKVNHDPEFTHTYCSKCGLGVEVQDNGARNLRQGFVDDRRLSLDCDARFAITCSDNSCSVNEDGLCFEEECSK